jgi:organic radical activating enzyme
MEDMEVLQKLQGLGLVSSRVIISGGEPLLQDEGLVDLVKELRNNFQIDIETAGTILPVHLELLPDTYVVSPKLANSGNAPRVRYRPQVIEWFASSAAWPKTYFKFVVSRLDDFGEIDAMVKTHGIIRSHVYIMPEGTTPRAVTEGARLVADATIDRGYNLSLRSHVYIWGDKRAH